MNNKVIFIGYNVIDLCGDSFGFYIWYIMQIVDFFYVKVFNNVIVYYCFGVIVRFFSRLKNKVDCVVKILLL